MVVWTWRGPEIDINMRGVFLCAGSALKCIPDLCVSSDNARTFQFSCSRYEYEHKDKISFSAPLTVGERTMLSDFPSPRFCLSAVLFVSVGGVASGAGVRVREPHNNSRSSLAARSSSHSFSSRRGRYLRSYSFAFLVVSFLPWPHSCF
jgi:hypothetical protein